MGQELAAGEVGALDFHWLDHGLQGNGGATSDEVDVSKFIDFADPANQAWNGFTLDKIKGNKKVKVIDADTFRIIVPTQTAAQTGISKSMTCGATFMPYGWVERTYSGGATNYLDVNWELGLKAKIQEYGGANNVNIAQRIVQGPNGFYSAVSGTHKAIVKVPDPRLGTLNDFLKGSSFERCTGVGPQTGQGQLPADQQGRYLTEPSIAYDSVSGNLFGFLRTQENPYTRRPEFWWAPESTMTLVSTAAQRPIKAPIACRCPILTEIGDDGYIYGFATERLTEYTGDAEFRGAYLLRCHRDNAFSTATDKGGPAFDIFEIGEVHLLSQSQNYPPVNGIPYAGPGRSSEASHTGLPCVIKHGSWIVWIYEEQELGAWGATVGINPPKVAHNWCNLKFFAVDTRPIAEGEQPLKVRGIL